jgi:hypothetical protein
VRFFHAAATVRLVTPGHAGFLDNALQPHIARLQHLYIPAQLRGAVFASTVLCFLHTRRTSQAPCSTGHAGMAFNYELSLYLTCTSYLCEACMNNIVVNEHRQAYCVHVCGNAWMHVCVG